MNWTLMRTAAGLLIVCSVALAFSGVEQVAAQGATRQTADFRFTEQRAGVSSGIALAIDYVNPSDPDGKPPAVRTVIEKLARGARIDTLVPEQCTAANAQLMAQGESACPPGSRVGTGTIKIDTGFPGPERYIVADVTFINNEDELIFLSTERGSGARVVSRSPVVGRKFVNEAPTLPGTPPDGAALDRVKAHLDPVTRRIDGARRGYITTPARCPAGGAWTNSIRFTYADGVTQSTDDRSRCESAAGAGRCGSPWRGGDGADRQVGTRRSDLLFGSGGPDTLLGRGGADCLRGQGGADRLRGGRGADRLLGGAGRDRLTGGPGADLIRGSSGNDAIYARGQGPDVIHCGSGRDEVRAGARDRVAASCERVVG